MFKLVIWYFSLSQKSECSFHILGKSLYESIKQQGTLLAKGKKSSSTVNFTQTLRASSLNRCINALNRQTKGSVGSSLCRCLQINDTHSYPKTNYSTSSFSLPILFLSLSIPSQINFLVSTLLRVTWAVFWFPSLNVKRVNAFWHYRWHWHATFSTDSLLDVMWNYCSSWSKIENYLQN